MTKPLDDLDNTGNITPVYEEHEIIPPDHLIGNVHLEHDRHRMQWKERFANLREVEGEEYDEAYLDTDSGDIENLQTQMWRLEARIEALEEQHDMLERALSSVGAAVRVAQLERSVEKPTLSERFRTWWRTH